MMTIYPGLTGDRFSLLLFSGHPVLLFSFLLKYVLVVTFTLKYVLVDKLYCHSTMKRGIPFSLSS